MGAVFTPEQDNFQFFEDNNAEPVSGDELGTENEQVTLPDNTSAFRIRLQIDETGGKGATDIFACQYEYPASNWNQLGPSVHFDWNDGQGTHGSVVSSNVLTGTTESGEFHEQTGGSDRINANVHHELDLSIIPTGNVLAGQTYNFRISMGGTPVPLKGGSTQLQLTTAAAGDVTVEMNPALMTIEDQPPTIVPGAVALEMPARTATVEDQALAVVPGEFQVPMQPAAGTLTAESLRTRPMLLFTSTFDQDAFGDWDGEVDVGDDLTSNSLEQRLSGSTCKFVSNDTGAHHVNKNVNGAQDHYVSFWMKGGWSDWSSLAEMTVFVDQAADFVWEIAFRRSLGNIEIRVKYSDYTSSWTIAFGSSPDIWHHIEMYATSGSNKAQTFIDGSVLLLGSPGAQSGTLNNFRFGAPGPNGSCNTTVYFDAFELWADTGDPGFVPITYHRFRVLAMDKTDLTVLDLSPTIVPGGVQLPMSAQQLSSEAVLVLPWRIMDKAGEEGWDFEQGLVGVWYMEEDAGSNRVDSSTQANDLEEAGDTSGATVDRNSESVQGSWSAGTFADSDEGRLRREDADLSSSFPGKSSTDNPFTIGGWVYPLDFPNAQRQIVCKGPNDIEIYWEGPSAGTAKFTFVVAGESISVSLGVPGAPQWYLVILRYDKDGVPPWMHASIYADTISWQIPAVIPRGFPIGNPANSDEFSVGARLESVDEFHLNGYVDELFAYDRVLSVWEMDLIWQHGLQTILDNVFILPNPVEMLLADQALNVIPGAVSVPLPTRAMTLTPEVLVVITAEPQIIAMNPATMTLADQPLQVAPGAVGLDMDALGMTVTELPFQVIPGGTTVQLPPRAATLADQPLNVAPGPVALLMNPLEALVTAMTTTVVPGEVTALMDALQAQVVQLALDVVPGAVTLPMQTRTLTIGTQVLTVLAPGVGAQFIDMGVVGMVAATQAFTVVPGAIGINLPTREATLTTENAEVIPGAALIAMQAAELTISDLSLIVLPGNVSVLLPTRTLLIEDQPPTVSAVTTILMNALDTTVAPQSLVVVPGAVDVELPAREMAITTEAVEASLAHVIVLMDQLGMTLTTEQLTVVALHVTEHRTIDIYADDRIIRISRDGRGEELT